ncbi:MAG TPA: amino acid permease [Kofleriaceae bacterium]|nr:amino acid permease [Kofleriaceae bacterium]
MSGLLRRLGRIDALAIALGGVIGVGVFRATGVVLGGSGGFAEATALWVIVGIVCMAGAVLYADLSARVPEAGGGYAYVRVAFGRPAAFVYGWMNGGISMPARQASVMLVIGEVLASSLPGEARLWAASMLVVLVAINLLGVRAGALVQRVLTAGKIGTILLVIVLAIVAAPGAGSTAAAPAALSLAAAVSACWYAYIGWQDATLLAEELREPRRDLPFVLVGSVAAVLVLYTSIHVAVYLGLGGAAHGELPARDVAVLVLGGAGFSLLSALMLSSMIGGAAEAIMVRPRIIMAAARDGLAPAPIAAIDRRGTPYGAILFHSALAMLIVATGSFTEQLKLLAFAQGFLGVFESASYFVVRRLRPELPTSRFHPWAPLVFLLANAALCALTAHDDPARIGVALGLIGAISAVYAVYAAIRRKLA